MKREPQKGRAICIAAGGSGGHVIPAQALAKELEKRGYSSFFAADKLSSNRFFTHNEFQTVDIPSLAPNFKSPRKMISFALSLGKGVLRAYSLIRREKPALVVGFGSYHTVSLLIAAWMTKTPIVLHEANAHPGRVIRLFSKTAQWIGCLFPEAAQLLKRHAREIKIVDLPLRESIHNIGRVSRNDAHDYFSFDPSIYTVLIVGGSQGAKKMNDLISQALPHVAVTLAQERKNHAVLQIIHLAGSDEEVDRAKERYAQSRSPMSVVVKKFESNMHYAMKASDLIIARSGASTLHEIEKADIPALLIPYPYAKDNHQLKNAVAYMQSGACAKVIQESELTFEKTVETISDLIASTQQRSRHIQEREINRGRKLASFVDEIESTLRVLERR